MKYDRLDKINSLEDFKRMKGREMPALAEEIREYLIEHVTESGGHLASNLGVVELSMALHRCFDSPKDHIIWDVGHQSYVHKLLTGRKEAFDTLRTPGGLSGFTKRSESEHDCFGAGHSSTSLSAALGFAESDARRGSDAYTVVVLGDGAFTGGMIHEAINNCRKDLKLIIILNENEMSIARNIGGFARHMSRIRSSKRYFKLKDTTVEFIENIPYLGKGIVDIMRDTKQALKNVIYSSNYFEEMGLYYMGPVDGNDYNAVLNMIDVAKHTEQSCVIHLYTKKGKGYPLAEREPHKYHMVPKGGVCAPQTGFSDMMGRVLVHKATECKDLCAITAAMPHGTGLMRFKKRFPGRLFDVGIAEEHAATFAAGLAANGMKPFFAVYSSFLQRAYDNIIHDIALQKLPVTICIDRTGLNEGDGATHHGIFDVSFLSSIPNMEIYCPVTYDSLAKAIDSAYDGGTPCAVRYPKGGEKNELREAFSGEGYVHADFTSEDKPDCVIVTYGDIAVEALRAENLFNCKTILLEKLKPYADTAKAVSHLIPDSCKTVIFLEEGIRNGGAALCLWDKLREYPRFGNIRFIVHAIDDDFVIGESGVSLRKSAGLTAEDMFESYKQEKF